MGAAVGDREVLESLLGRPELAWLVTRVRARISPGQSAALAGVVQLDAPTGEQRAAAVKLVGRPRRTGEALRVDLADVEAVLRRGPWPAGLANAVVTLTGPVVDRTAERQLEGAAWDRARAGLDAAVGRLPGMEDWWVTWCATGGLKRTARAEAARLGLPVGPHIALALVGQLSDVLEALPADGVPLAVFARQILGDAHGLDDTRALGRLAATAVGAAYPSGEPTSTEISRREAWASAGVVMSNVSSTVLSLGVPGSGAVRLSDLATATSTALEAMRAARSPVLLTLDQVRSGGIASLSAESVVHVCENPTVVEVVALHWGRRSQHSSGPGPVLVCTSGQASTAVLEILELLTAAGAQCRYHGDFDWGGLRIAQVVRARVPWVPWRFSASDYREEARRQVSSLQLVGSPAAAPWDPELPLAMLTEGHAVEEEAVADLLATDILTQ